MRLPGLSPLTSDFLSGTPGSVGRTPVPKLTNRVPGTVKLNPVQHAPNALRRTSRCLQDH